MGKLGLAAIFAVGCAFAADQYWNYGRHTDGVVSTLRQIQHALGW
jgi:hypothetical protein